MADPLLAKISELPEMADSAAADQLPIVDASDNNDETKTKRVRMDKLKIITADQITDGIVENSKLADGAVTSGKLGAGAVIAGKIAVGGVSAANQIANGVVGSAQMAAGAALANIATGSITTGKLADDAVTEEKLGAIKRTVAIPIFGLEDAVIVKNFTRVFAWPPTVNGHVITGASAVLLGSVSTSGNVGLTLVNQGGTVGTITINQDAWSGSIGAINESYRTAQSYASFSVNVTAQGSGAFGLTVYLEITG